jgi:pilus assembly protein Flp/PilA
MGRSRYFRRRPFGQPFASEEYMKRFIKFLCNEDGPTAVEYAVMLALIVGAALTGITSFGQATLNSFQDSSTKINTAVGS